jgi:hypothetical protein
MPVLVKPWKEARQEFSGGIARYRRTDSAQRPAGEPAFLARRIMAEDQF